MAATVVEQLKTRRLDTTVRNKRLMCLTCGSSTLSVSAYRAVLGYCQNCKLTFMYTYVPTAYLCTKCGGRLTFKPCSVVRSRCGSCKIQVDFVSEVDDWNVFWNLTYDIIMRRAEAGSGFLLSTEQPIVVRQTATKAKGMFKLSEAVKAKLRDIMKRKWQETEYRRKVIEGMRRSSGGGKEVRTSV
jgi:hypothetical protein